MFYIAGPGHGGPALVGNTYLEGTYSEIYPNITQNEAGMKNCSRSFPFRAAFPATSRPRRQGPFTKAASSDIRSVTPSARRSTIPT